MEAKSQDVQLGRWKYGRANGVIPLQRQDKTMSQCKDSQEEFPLMHRRVSYFSTMLISYLFCQRYSSDMFWKMVRGRVIFACKFCRKRLPGDNEQEGQRATIERDRSGRKTVAHPLPWASWGWEGSQRPPGPLFCIPSTPSPQRNYSEYTQTKTLPNPEVLSDITQ